MNVDIAGDVTTLLTEVHEGTPGAADRLMTRVYSELRVLAGSRARGSKLLEPTALVNEAYLKLFGQPNAAFENRKHFFWAAAQAMRDILVDDARRVGSAKRGAGMSMIAFGEIAEPQVPASSVQQVDLLALNDALAKLELTHPTAAKVVMLRFFAGLPRAEVAAETGLNEAAVWREWVFAKVWLLAEIEGKKATDVR